ncbi:MAG: hypothetical protein ACEPOW_05855 [Bacteroidales bacterium]
MRKSFVFLLCFLFYCKCILAQEMICFQGFENSQENAWNYQKVVKNGEITKSKKKVRTGEYSLCFSGSSKKGDDPSIVFEALEISDSYKCGYLQVCWAANGPDAGDDLYLDIKKINTPSWCSAKNVSIQRGYSNLVLAFDEFFSESGFSVLKTNPGFVYLKNIPDYLQFRIRFNEKNSSDNTKDSYYIDDIYFYGLTKLPKPNECKISDIGKYKLTLTVESNEFKHKVLIIRSKEKFSSEDVLSDGDDCGAIGDAVFGGEIIYFGIAKSFKDTSLDLDTEYNYQIYSVDKENKNYSKPYSISTKTLAGAPKCNLFNVNMSSEVNSIYMDWDYGVKDSIPDGYLLQCSLDDSFVNPEEGKILDQNLSVSNIDDGVYYLRNEIPLFYWTSLKPGTKYYFRLLPFNNWGNQISYKLTNNKIIQQQTLEKGLNSEACPWSCYNLANEDAGDFWTFGFLYYDIISETLFLTDNPIVPNEGNCLKIQTGDYSEFFDLQSIPNNNLHRISFKASLKKDINGNNYLCNITSPKWENDISYWVGEESGSWVDANNWFPNYPNLKTEINILSDKTNSPFCNDVSEVQCRSVNMYGSFSKRPVLSIKGNAISNIPLHYYMSCHGYDQNESTWTYLSSPAGEIKVNQSCFIPHESEDLYKWSESQNAWLNYKQEQNSISKLCSGEGFLYASKKQKPICFYGEICTQDIEFNSLSFSPKFGNGYHFLGNPFVDSLLWNPDNLELQGVNYHAYLWDEQSGNYKIKNNQKIPPCSGFFIKVEDVNNHIKLKTPSAINIPVLKVLPESDFKVEVEITNKQNYYKDEFHFVFTTNGSENYSYKNDAPKLFGVSQAPQIYYIDKSGIQYSKKTLPLNSTLRELFFDAPDGTYTVEIKTKGNLGYTLLRFVDGKYIELKQLHFNIEVGSRGGKANLMAIQLKGNSLYECTGISKRILTASYNKDRILLKSNDSKIHTGKLSIFDLQGRLLLFKSKFSVYSKSELIFPLPLGGCILNFQEQGHNTNCFIYH